MRPRLTIHCGREELGGESEGRVTMCVDITDCVLAPRAAVESLNADKRPQVRPRLVCEANGGVERFMRLGKNSRLSLGGPRFVSNYK